ncbi:MAG: DUF1579 domain-containing protein [Deltaproteobacteria bacterium]|nr:DUF1579 domain-containing protein [Deltaproteobacteria bacterium]
MAKESTVRKETDMQSMMNIYRELATPTAPHNLLGKMEGSWSVKSICWMEPGSPVESSGTSEQKMVLEGRFLQQEFSGDMAGSPFSGIGYCGYDNHTGKYVSTWMDTMGTGIYYFEGTADAEGKTITQTCNYDDPVQGPVKWRSVTRLVDDDTLEFEMYITNTSGKEEKVAEMTYTRSKYSMHR